MSIKKWLMTTGLILSLSIVVGCDQQEEDSAGELDQEEIEETEGPSSDENLTDEEGEVEQYTETEESDNGENETTGSEDSEETNDSDSSKTNDQNIDEEGQADSDADDAIQLDLEEDILNPSSIAALVNKEYSLPEDYTPDDLVTVEVPTVLPNPEIKQMREVAADALKELFDAAEEEGLILHARSGYRSYETQVQLFQNYASNHGQEAANKYSARAGESEHQTGLVMDITSESVNLQITSDFGDTEEGQWVKDNAHTFGFIIRYPEGKSDITGYIYEPWHIRYLGEELATEVYESGLTYEEYLIERGMDIEI